MRDYCACVTDINCHVSSPKMFRRDYSILEKFHRRNSKFSQPVKSNLTPFHPADILFETTTPTSPSLPPSLPSFLSVRCEKKVNVARDLLASPNFVRGIEFRTCPTFFFLHPLSRTVVDSVYISTFCARPRENYSIFIFNFDRNWSNVGI